MAKASDFQSSTLGDVYIYEDVTITGGILRAVSAADVDISAVFSGFFADII